MTWLIARRAALEALQDPLSLLVGLFFALVLPLGAAHAGDPARGCLWRAPESALGAILAFYLLVVGVLPAFSAVGIAAGQFAGEKERGMLTPLLASPASNVAIFGGKVLGAIIPPLVYAAVAEAVYLVGAGSCSSAPRCLGLLPVAAAATVLLVPAGDLLRGRGGEPDLVARAHVQRRAAARRPGADAGLGSRLRPGAALQDWGPLALFGAIAGLLLLDVALTALAAATWRREEVLAQRERVTAIRWRRQRGLDAAVLAELPLCCRVDRSHRRRYRRRCLVRCPRRRGTRSSGSAFVRRRSRLRVWIAQPTSRAELAGAIRFQLIRLGAYWNRIEPRAGVFDTGELDWQVEAAERAGKQIVLCVGALKTFGYPEFFVPAHRLPRAAARRHRSSAVRLSGSAGRGDRASRADRRALPSASRAIVAWQVEHEAVDPLGIEHSWRLAAAFVEQEVAAVRRPIPPGRS